MNKYWTVLMKRDRELTEEMISLFKDIWKRDNIIIHKVEGKAADKSLDSIRTDFNYNLPDYTKMFTELYEWIRNNNSLYSKYL